jgi:hypothetical protein
MEFVGFGLFFAVWVVFFLASVGGVICAVAALVSISRMDAGAFGPWWDNTKTTWLVGIAVSFAIPFGSLVTGLYWFSKGRATLPTSGVALRPFWAGPPKPMPQWPPAGGYPPPPPQTPLQPPPPQPPHPEQPNPPG